MESYKIVFESADDGILIINYRAIILDANPKFVRITDVPKEKLIGQSIFNLAKGFITKKQIPHIIKLFKKFIRKEPVERYTIEHQSRVYEVTGKRWGDGYIVVVFHDITEQEQIKVALEESEARYRSIVENSHEAIGIINHEAKFIFVNQNMTKLFGYPENEIVGTDFRVFLAEENREFVYNRFKNRQKGKQIESFYEVILQNKEGEKKYAELVSAVIYDKNNQPLTITHLIDITAKKLANKILKRSERNFRLIFEHSPLGIYVATRKGQIIDGNKALLNILGSPSIEATKNINVLSFPPLVRNGYAEKFLQCVSEGVTIEIVTPYRTKWGRETELHSFLVPLKNSSGEVEMVYTLLNDITERKRAENIQKVLFNISNATILTDNLKQLILIIKNELGKLIDTTNFFVALYDQETNTLSLPFYSDEHDSYSSFPAEKTITKYVIKTQKSLLADSKVITELEKSGEIERQGTNSMVWLGVPLKIDGEISGAIVVQSYTNENAFTEADKKMLEFVSDQIGMAISRKKSEDLLKKSEERFDLAMKASNDGLFDWDLVTNEIYYSARWKNILGYEDDELKNDLSVWESLTHPTDRKASLHKLKKAVENKIDHYNVEFRMKHKKGHWVNILSRAYLIFDEDENAIRAVGTHSDLTEQKKAEQELKEALKKAEESDRLKSAFLANMSHEIRTPMNGILGFANLLKKTDITPEQYTSYIQIIEKSGERMLGIINDLINISKIEAGQIDLTLSTFNINEPIKYLLAFFTPEAKKKKLSLIAKTQANDDEFLINTDREKLYAILTNLIKNSIKFTHEGSIEFGYFVKKDETGNFVEFYVKDTGIGIPEERQKAIFDRFVQADIADKKAYEGAGLGLSISKAFVNLLGGDIWVESQVNIGSTFFFKIPVNPVNKVVEQGKHIDPNKNVKSLHLKNGKILVAEDDEVSFIYLSILLKEIGLEILHASNGNEAVKLSIENPDINLILMDVKMPVLDGCEAVKQIRIFNKDVVIIAQTAHALEEDLGKTLAAGCDDYIPKPVNKDVLLEKINKYLT